MPDNTPHEVDERDPGLARERTSLAWIRTALSFAAVGAVVLKVDVVPGAIIMALAPAVWQISRLPGRSPRRLRLFTAAIVAVSVTALIVAALSSGRSSPIR